MTTTDRHSIDDIPDAPPDEIKVHLEPGHAPYLVRRVIAVSADDVDELAALRRNELALTAEALALRVERDELRAELARAGARIRLLEKRQSMVSDALNYRGEP